MPKEFSRIDRIGDQIQRELAQMIQRDIKDPRVGMVTINAVKVSRDMGYADIYVSLLTTEELTAESESVKESLAVLNKAAGFLRGQLGRAMKLRMVPNLRFHFDALLGKSRHMDALINEAVGKKSAVVVNQDTSPDERLDADDDSDASDAPDAPDAPDNYAEPKD